MQKTEEKLTILSQEDGEYKQRRCLCRCFCGKTFLTRLIYIKRGQRKSCGCLKRKVLVKRNTSHALSGIPEYQVWARIKACCTRKTHDRFVDYGGRGIKICDRWLKFENFIADMDRRPSDQHSIDRIDNNGNYEPSNCQWVTNKQQSRNRRNNRVLTCEGKSACLTEWAEQTGLSRKAIQQRLDRGWSLTEALTKPLIPTGKYIRRKK